MKATQSEVQNKLVSLIQDVRLDKEYLIYELSELLELSYDSVYRRLRGETLFNIEDIVRICKHFGFSFDSIYNIKQDNNLIFQFKPILKEEDFIQYLIRIRDDLKFLLDKIDVEIFYTALDTPIFYNFNFPIISSFKTFYWLKSLIKVSKLEKELYKAQAIHPKIKELTDEIYRYYIMLPSTEIWSNSMLDTILSQISYYWYSGIFNSKESSW